MSERARSCKRVQIFFEGKGRTKQSFREQCDINSIVAKANVTGVLSHLNKSAPVYADVSNLPDYRTSLDIVRNAEQMFMELPSRARERFDNNPAKMFDFLRDKGNFEEAVKLGLIEKKEVPPVVPPAPPAEGTTPAK